MNEQKTFPYLQSKFLVLLVFHVVLRDFRSKSISPVIEFIRLPIFLG